VPGFQGKLDHGGGIWQEEATAAGR
jgi:hypothetical protein